MFANIYLNEVDQYIKHKLKIKYYCRYLDDSIVIVKTKKEAKETLEKIKIFLRNNLELELNSKTQIFKNKQGVNFCGYKIQKYISSNIEKVRKKQMKYLYMNEQERQMQYYQFPKFLLELQLSQNARIIYMLLYDRARISRKNNWTDEDGRVYAIFPIEELSQKTGKCKSSVKKALKELDDAGLLIRKFGGFSKPRHMHVMIPDKVEISRKAQLQTDIKKADIELKNELSYGRNDNSTKDINTASNKVIEKNNTSNKYGVSSYSIKNQKINYECGEGESL